MTATVTATWGAPTTGTTPFTYQLRYSSDQTNWTLAGSPVNILTASVSGLPNGQTLYFEVAAINGAGQGPWSAIASITTT